jgi:Beta-glucosidase-related glycosidases
MKCRTKAAGLVLVTLIFAAGSSAKPANAQQSSPARALPWMAPEIVAQQQSARSDAEREAIANRRANLLLNSMTLPQKLQQLAGSKPEILPELPHCFGGRHVSGIPELAIPTFRITNGPVGVGQNDCIAASLATDVAAGRVPITVAYTHPTSAHATALPSALAAAAAFDPAAARTYGEVIAAEMNNLGLHVFEAPGANLARLPILGRNFEYFGEDPYLTGVMAVAETRAVQDAGLIAMVKHYAANEQETNRMTIRTRVDGQTLRELYLLPFEMAVKDGRVASVMCAYNYVNDLSSCENGALMNDVLREEWGFTGYVQSDFFAMKSTAATMKGGMDHEMPLPSFWSPEKLTKALAAEELSQADIDRALVRRYAQTFKAGIFDRPLVQTPIDFARGGAQARTVGTAGAALLQNNGALPFRRDVRTIVMIGKASQPYAQQAVSGGSRTGEPMGSGGGSSDVVPHYTISPVDGLRSALKELGMQSAIVKLVLVDDANETATIDGAPVSFADALKAVGAADAVLMMAGTISEEGADRATFVDAAGRKLAKAASDGNSLDWYATRNDVIAVARENAANTKAASLGGLTRVTLAKNSNTVAMLHAIMATTSTSGRAMARKTVLVLKDNAGVAMEPALVGKKGPAILEVWFPGQEDGNIVADLLLGRKNPGGKLPVTFPYVGRGFLDSITPAQFPGESSADSKTQTVVYSEKLHIGYRWYDANISGKCAPRAGKNPCVAFPFGHGLSYTTFALGKPRLAYDDVNGTWKVSTTVRNSGTFAGSEVVQVYISLPSSTDSIGAAQPPKRLIGFQKVELAPGQSRAVTITIDPKATHHPLGIWSAADAAWVTPAGSYRVWLGRSSSPADITEAGKIRIEN